jgi:alkylation response protein AidB-like acyl-CoA dehydrogenase
MVGHDRGMTAGGGTGGRRSPEVDQHPLVVRTQELAEGLLAPSAAEVDRTVVPASHLDALAAAGVLAASGPPELGGVPGPVGRRVQELLAGADLSTWFVQTQHQGAMRALVSHDAPDGVLADLAAGRRRAGIAFSHLRRRPARVLSATPDGDGWRLDGTAPWYTGWGLTDVAVVGALTGDDRVVLALVEPRESATLRAGEQLATAALAAARTVPLTLDGYRVPRSDVVVVQPAGAWAAADALGTANTPPAVFGLAESCLRLLAEHGVRRREPAAVAAAAALGAELDDVQDRAYHLVDAVPPGEALAERLALRARALRLAVDAGTALVTAGAGGAMAAGAPAQRKAREALFLLVQAQTADVRAATLATFAP